MNVKNSQRNAVFVSRVMASVAGEEEFDDSEVRFSAFVAVVTKSLRAEQTLS